MPLRSQVLLCTLVFSCTLSGFSQLPRCPQIKRSTDLPATLDSLTAPGSPPFHLKAVIHEGDVADSKTEVEVFWNSPQLYRRTIKGEEFSQTLIVNGDRIFEQDSDDYFPVWAETLVRATLDLGSVKEMINAGTFGHWLVVDRFQDFKGRAVPRVLQYVVDCKRSTEPNLARLTFTSRRIARVECAKSSLFSQPMNVPMILPVVRSRGGS